MTKRPATEAPKPAPPRRRAVIRPGGARRLLLPLFVLLLAALLAGCGSLTGAGKRAGEEAHEKPSPAEAVRLAYRTTSGARTARVAMTTTLVGAPAAGGGAGGGTQPAPATLALTADGVVDYAKGDAAMTMSLPGAGRMEMRILGGFAYQKLPEEARKQRPGSKPWAKIDMGRLYREQYGASPAEMRSSDAPSDPADQLRYLGGVSDEVREAGKEEVRGVPTTRYEATIDLKKAADKTEKGAAREAVEKMARQLGTSKVPVEVWLDAQGRVRRSEMTMPLPDNPRGGPAAKGNMKIVQELYDFGAPVRVEAPPPEQTEDVTDEVLKQSSSPGKAA